MAADDEALDRIDRWWRAANYLSVGQIYLQGDATLERPLSAEDVKPRLLGHFGTVPGLNLVYAHLNRVILERDEPVLFIAGPGHGGPATNANAWLDGTYSELYPDITRDAAGMRKLFQQFSYPGGVPSHTAPETPGSIQEGGELGYSLAHAFGAVLDDPDLTVVCVVGDGEAESGPLAASWHGNRFLDPRRDGMVLPILHLNGWKIANPTLLARIPEPELAALMTGYGYDPIFVTIDASEPHADAHERFAAALDRAFSGIDEVRRAAADGARVPWPMIVLRSPKGWTGPEEVDGVPVEGTWRSHQVPLADVRGDADHLRMLEEWLRAYGPDDLFDDAGAPRPSTGDWGPRGTRRMSAIPQANGIRRELDLPGIDEHVVDVDAPGGSDAGATEVLGGWLVDVIGRNPETFRIFSPDELESNRLAPGVFEATEKQWNAEVEPVDEHLAPHGRVMEVLSEHLCQGWLEGYTLTGRHGLFTSYEAFIHIVDSMFNQHAKWLEACAEVPWREPLPAFTYLLSSHVWQQDHNGFTHQDPGFIDLVMNKSADIVRVYLPFDANTLLVTMAECMAATDRINVVVAGKKPAPQWLDADDAREHVRRGIGELPWAGNTPDGETPDVVLAAAGDVPTQEVIAAAELLRDGIPDLKVRVVNVVDLATLQSPEQHPAGLADAAFDALFTTDRPVVFAYHGYPALIHRLAYKRNGHENLHVHGYRERGTTTTPFDMLMLNDIDRYRLAVDAIDRVPGLATQAADVRAELVTAREQARRHTREHGVDIPVIADWRFAARS
ncbi:phosphoketolase family protein [Microbacterium aerolatum]|uniref:Putative phosphoketolase n=1 Tax=Microbacterium aerolatum TaxID=153731 RepID=A0A511AEW8_9MICO|nr:phosphoketolase family protein [Microbacterium aerolatum]GEK86566.1 putative phosphoketolase [Microbacterium aerolatum]GGB17917.1 putative phosphoketolase [Microbacterium aerolatum]